MHKFLAAAGVLLAMVVGRPTMVRADPILLTGQVFFVDTNTDGLFFVGAELRVQTTLTADFFWVPKEFFTDSCTRGTTMCSPGEIFDNTFRTPGDVSLGPATATVGGVDYGVVNLLGSLEFLTMPTPAPDPGQGFQWVHVPFVMSGLLRAVDAQGNELFNQAITGQGEAASIWYRFRQENPGAVYPEDGKVFYEINDVAATPEPASMVLLATGLGAAFAVRRRRREQAVP